MTESIRIPAEQLEEIDSIVKRAENLKRPENETFTLTERIRIQVVLSQISKIVSSLADDSKPVTQKNNKKAAKLREEGNYLFKKSAHTLAEHYKIWSLYAQSAATAMPHSEDMAKAYSNLAILMSHFNEYTSSLQYIEKALHCGYKDILKLHILKSKCFVKLQDFDNARKQFDFLHSLLKKLPVNDVTNKDTNAILETLEKELQKKNCSISNKLLQPSKVSVKIANPHKMIPCASDAIELKVNEKYGRHLIAATDIGPGQILIKEKFYAYAPSGDNLYTHCSHCSKITLVITPCDQCTSAVYCSVWCQNTAWKEYHSFECVIIHRVLSNVQSYRADLSIDSAISIILKLFIKIFKSVEGRVEELNNLMHSQNDKEPNKSGFTDGTFKSDTYSFLSLTTSTLKKSLQFMIMQSVASCLVLYFFAKETPLFGKKIENAFELASNSDYITIGTFISRLSHTISMNRHSMSIFLRHEHFAGSLAAGEVNHSSSFVAPFSSFLNHSCFPNAEICTNNGHVVVYSKMPIKEGEQIFFSYKSTVFDDTKFERQQELINYSFTCDCIACTNDWPTYSNAKYFTEDKNHILYKRMQKVNSVFLSNLSTLEFRKPALEAFKTVEDMAAPYCLENYFLIKLTDKISERSYSDTIIHFPYEGLDN